MQLGVPKGLQLQIMQAAHNDVLPGHLGVAKTYEVGNVRQRFYWFSMFQDNTLLSILWTVILLIIIYLLYLKFA